MKFGGHDGSCDAATNIRGYTATNDEARLATTTQTLIRKYIQMVKQCWVVSRAFETAMRRYTSRLISRENMNSVPHTFTAKK